MARKYGITLFLYDRNAGVRMINAAIIECVGPLCSINGIRISISGIIERVRIKGILMSVFRIEHADLPIIYPSDRWPIAYDFSSSVNFSVFS